MVMNDNSSTYTKLNWTKYQTRAEKESKQKEAQDLVYK